MDIGTLLNRRKRILRKGIYPTLGFVVMEESTLGEVINRLEYDRFHIIFILNNEFEIIGKITEADIINASQNYGSGDKIANVFKSILRDDNTL